MKRPLFPKQRYNATPVFKMFTSAIYKAKGIDHRCTDISAAFRIAKEPGFYVETKAINELIRRYMDLNNKTLGLSFYVVNYILEFAIISYSRNRKNKTLLDKLIKFEAFGGREYSYKTLLEVLKRQPEKIEVEMFMQHYLKGAVSSNSIEHGILELARMISSGFEEEIRQKFKEREEQWSKEVY